MNKETKVSVIIPVYNTEKYLRQCLDSVVNQTLRDIEIICVDDGSTDGSIEILREYEQKDSRVKVLCQKNQYAGVARNNGMTIASGEYYMFLDADDFFELELLEKLYQKGKDLNADVVLCGANQYDERTGQFKDMPWLLKERYIHKQPFNWKTQPNRIFQVTSLQPWNKMVSSSFISENNLKFQALPRANDVYFTMSAIALANRIAAINTVMVHYRVGMSSNLQAQNEKTPLSFCEALTAVQERLETEGLMEQLWLSFAEDALSQSVYNLKRLQGKMEAYQTLANALEEHYLDDFFVWKGIKEKKLDKTFSKQLVELLDGAAPLLKVTTVRMESTDKTPCVSIIIPVYNVEKYLRTCLDSVINQTMRNIEIICVNDGSTDNSADILKEYQQKDQRVQVITQRNSGLSIARNTGMARACGEYIYFLDSDDYLEINAMERLFSVCKENVLDVIHFDFDRFYDDGTKGRSFERQMNLRIYDGVSFLRWMKEHEMYTSVVWAQMFRREFLEKNKLLFYPGIIHEDELFTFSASMEAQRVAHLRQKLYHHRLRENSIMTTEKSAKNVMGYFVCMREMMIYGMRKKYPTVKKQQIYRAFEGMRRTANNLYMKLSDKERANLVFDDVFSAMLFENLVLKVGTENQNKIKEVIPQGNSQVERMLVLKNKLLIQEIQNIHSSATYKIGRFITFLPRKLRGGVQCYREHGAAYTFQRLLIHLHLLKDPYTAVSTEVKIAEKDTESIKSRKSQVQIKKDYQYYARLSKEQYAEELTLWFQQMTGQQLNLDAPKTFNEKIQWLKLYDSTPIKTQLADKYLMRDWVNKRFGSQYLIPLLGVWDSFDEISFDSLPEQFALKANHGSGWNMIVLDKEKFDVEDANRKFTRWLGTNFALAAGFEMHYMNIPPRIIAEEYHPCQYEYQYWCFNGTPQFISAIHEPHGENGKSTYDLKWNELDFVTSLPRLKNRLSIPPFLEKMNQIAQEICKEFAFVRVDFLSDEKSLFVGEITFTPASGKCQWNPEQYDRILGDWLTLPPKSPIPEKQF